MRVLVTGSRFFRRSSETFALLDYIHSQQPITCIINGGAPGADAISTAWAVAREIPHHIYPARWLREGRAAGPIRNAKMLRESNPDVVVGLPGNTGTRDMLARARAAGVPTYTFVMRREHSGKGSEFLEQAEDEPRWKLGR